MYLSPIGDIVEAKPGFATAKKFLKAIPKTAIHQGVRGGSSTVLAKRLGIYPGSGMQAHHIIPVQLREHPVLNKISFDLDRFDNGIALPNSSRISSDLPVHRGYHSEYNNAVRRDLDKIPLDLSIEETERRVIRIMHKYRYKIESGISLYQRNTKSIWK